MVDVLELRVSESVSRSSDDSIQAVCVSYVCGRDDFAHSGPAQAHASQSPRSCVVHIAYALQRLVRTGVYAPKVAPVAWQCVLLVYLHSLGMVLHFNIPVAYLLLISHIIVQMATVCEILGVRHMGGARANRQSARDSARLRAVAGLCAMILPFLRPRCYFATSTERDMTTYALQTRRVLPTLCGIQ